MQGFLSAYTITCSCFYEGWGGGNACLCVNLCVGAHDYSYMMYASRTALLLYRMFTSGARLPGQWASDLSVSALAPSTRVTDAGCCAQILCRCWGSELKSSSLCNRHFNDRNMPQLCLCILDSHSDRCEIKQQYRFDFHLPGSWRCQTFFFLQSYWLLGLPLRSNCLFS